MEEVVNITITKEQIFKKLKSILKSEHAHLISKIIIDNLAITEVGLSQLYKSFTGVEDTVDFRLGDEVYVEWNQLNTWRFNKDKMIANGLLEQGVVRCTIIEINMCRNCSIQISHPYYRDADDEIQTDTSWVSPNKITPADDGIIDSNYELNNELPF